MGDYLHVAVMCVVDFRGRIYITSVRCGNILFFVDMCFLTISAKGHYATMDNVYIPNEIRGSGGT